MLCKGIIKKYSKNEDPIRNMIVSYFRMYLERTSKQHISNFI